MPNNNGGGNIYSSSFLFSVSFVIVVTFSLIYANIINSNTNSVSITDAYAKISSYKSQLDDTNIQGADINFISESSPPNMQSERSSDSASSPPPAPDAPSSSTTTAPPADNQKGDQIIPDGGTTPLDQSLNDNNNATSKFAVPPDLVPRSDNLNAIPQENNSGIFPSLGTLTNQTNTITGPTTNNNTVTPITNGTIIAPSPPTNGTNPQGTGGNTTNISIAIAIAVQNIVNRISSGGTNNVQLQTLIQQLITLLVKQGQANNPNIKFVELQSVPINEFFANNTRLGPQVKITSHAVFVDPSTGKIFAKGIVKNTGTSTIASVTTYADEFDISNHFINRTQSAPNTMPLKPGDSFNYTIDLGGYFTGKFDNHEIAAVTYQLAAKNAIAAAPSTSAAAPSAATATER
jgi:hypothetical protein